MAGLPSGGFLDNFFGSSSSSTPSPKPLRYPLETANRPGFMRFTPIDGETGQTIEDDDIMELMLPSSGLKFADGMNFENKDFGIVRGAMVSGVDQASAQAAGAAAADFFNNIGEPGTVGKGIGTLTSMIGVDISQARTRSAPNPNTRALFKNPNLREFSFDFKMIPTSPTEAEVIASIVKTFRKHMYPTRLERGGKVRIGYKYPSMFRIEIFLGYDDKYYEVEPKIKPCFLKAANTSYNTSTGSIMAERGEETANFSFVETDLSISFTEEVTLVREDIEKDNY